MNHIHQLWTYKTIILPLYMTYDHSGNLPLWSLPSHIKFFRHSPPEGNSWQIRLHISNASVGACTPPFRRFLLLLFFIWFFCFIHYCFYFLEQHFCHSCASPSLTRFLPKTHPLLIHPHWPNSTKPDPKPELPKVVFGQTWPGKWWQNQPHKLPVHNSNILAPHSPRQKILLKSIPSSDPSLAPRLCILLRGASHQNKNLYHLCADPSKS